MKKLEKIKRNREILEQAFPLAYIQNGLNGTKTYKQLKKNITDKTAGVEASKTLAKPIVREKIMELMESRGLSVSLALDTHKKNMVQRKHLPTSQRAVETVYELAGVLKNRDNSGNHIQVGVIIKND